MIQYQIFTDSAAADIKNINIDSLLGYPNAIAQCYRKNALHPDVGDLRVACVVEDELVDACQGMTPEQRLEYYDSEALKDLTAIKTEGWYPDLPPFF